MINGFDYSKYLKQKKIFGIVKSKNLKVIGQEKNFNFYIFKVKEYLFKKIEENYKNEEIGFLKAILLGDTNSLDENIKENFKKANISHVLAISGMHISYIVMGLEKILKRFIKNSKLRNFIIIVFLMLYTILVGGSNSVCRACIMASIAYIGNIILRKDDFYASFKVALCILLIMNPYNIFSGSMWLSFGGSIGIVLYSKLIEKIILKKIRFENHKKDCLKVNILVVRDKIIKKAISIISVTLGAQIVVFPIMIYIFNSLSINFIISNLLISELVGPILVLGYLCLLFPVISIFERILIKIFFFFAEISANLPLLNIQLVTPNLYKIIIYYMILAFIVFIYNTKKFYFFRKIKKEKIKIVFIFISILFFLFGNINFPFRKDFEIHFLDVGQGDSCLIRTNSNKIILIDRWKRNRWGI